MIGVCPYRAGRPLRKIVLPVDDRRSMARTYRHRITANTLTKYGKFDYVLWAAVDTRRTGLARRSADVEIG